MNSKQIEEARYTESDMKKAYACGHNRAWFQFEDLLNQSKREQKPVEEDATVKMLDDIISWEKDLSEYHSLEGILRERYKITKR